MPAPRPQGEITYDTGSSLRRTRPITEMSRHGSPASIAQAICDYQSRLDDLIAARGDEARGSLESCLRRIFLYATGESTEPEIASYARKYAAQILAFSISSVVTQVESDDIPVLENIDPFGSDLTVLCCAALGRYRMEVEKDDVPDFWFSAFTGNRIATIRAYISRNGVERPKHRSKRYISHKDAVVMSERMR